jgi:N-acetylglutamate synthase-like GNAT family acetyltransferase
MESSNIDLYYRLIEEDDIPELTKVMQRAFDDDAQRIVGGMIVWILPDNQNILGTIFIDPDYQDCGIGQKSWQFIEGVYPQTDSWRLATPSWAVKNYHFYQKCGFQEVSSDPLIPPEEQQTIYRKEISASLQQDITEK